MKKIGMIVALIVGFSNVLVLNAAQAGILTCTTDEAHSRQFVLAVDTLSQQAGSGILFQLSDDGALLQIYPSSSTASGQNAAKPEVYLRAYDSTEVKWKGEHDCFRVVGSQYRFLVSLDTPQGMQTLSGNLEETIGARINPKGMNCPHPFPPRPQRFKLSCKPF